MKGVAGVVKAVFWGNPQTQKAKYDNQATLHPMPPGEGGFGLRLVFSVTIFFFFSNERSSIEKISENKLSHSRCRLGNEVFSRLFNIFLQ